MRNRVLGLILTAALLLTACENTIRYEYDRNDAQITLLAQLTTADTDHTVYLSMSYPDRVEEVTGATVVCTVGGVSYPAVEQPVPMGESYEYDPETGEYNLAMRPRSRAYTAYVFSATIRPGDEVYLEASKGNLKAWAEVTVPQPARFIKVDTATVVRTLHYLDFGGEGTYEDTFVDVTASIREAAPDSYFTLTASRVTEGEFRYYDADGNLTRTEPYAAEDRSVNYETFHDGILEDGYSAGESSSLLSELLVTNQMHCFSDKEFRDGEATVRPSFDSEDFHPSIRWRYAWIVPEDAEADLHGIFRLHLRTIDRDFYNYLRALNNMQTYGYDVTPIIEPTMLPNNVVDGFGMVSVAAEETVSFDLGTVHIHRDPEIYY